MMKADNFQSVYNTDKIKYTGPLAIVEYQGTRNIENQMHGHGNVLFANGSRYVGQFGK